MSHPLRRVILLAFCLVLLAAPFSAGATATTYNYTYGSATATALGTEASTASYFTGAGAWRENLSAAKFEWYIDPVATFGAAFTIDDIASITYHTNALAPGNVDFFTIIYTMPCPGGDTDWYCHRLTAEPLYASGYVAPTPGVWNTYTTNPGTAPQLTWNDANATGNQGFYGGPTLQTIQAGAIDWSTYGWGTKVRDYGPETVEYISFQTGTPWNTVFDGYLDAITIALNNGATYNIDLEAMAAGDVWVDDDWAGAATGTEVAPGKFFGFDAFAKIQDGVNAVATGSTVNVAAGAYNEDVNLNKQVSLVGAGAATTTIVGQIGGDGATVRINASSATVAGFTITRAGNNTTDWDNAGLNGAGIAIQGLTWSGTVIRDNVITGNRTGIDINNSNGHTIRNNVLDFNRTGLVLRNQTDSLTIVENNITNNWTVGMVFLDASGGSNSPVQTALNCDISNNKISGNWYGGIVDRQTGGSLPAPGTNLKNFSGDWFGTASPAVSTANSSEPGYSAQIPVAYGGTATPPAAPQPDILGPASANFDFTPLLGVGTDTNVETTAGRGTNGFQGDFSSLYVTAAGAQTGSTGRIEEGLGLVSAGGTVNVTAGAFTVLGNTDMTKANVTLAGAGAANTHVQVSGAGYRFSVLAPGVVIRDLDIVKTDKTAEQNIIWINASNVQVKNNTIHGQWAFGDGEVVRAMVVSGGNNGLLFEGNTIYALRQPAYVSGPVTGDVKTNLVYGTKGWVLEGGCLTFTGNTWGTGNVVDIAILSSVPSSCYTDIAAMSAANNNAVIEDQRVTPKVLSVVYVNAAAPAGGTGGQLDPLNDLNLAWTRVAPGGQIVVAGAGTYNVAAGAHPGGMVITANGVTINLGGATIGHGSPAFTIDADDVTIVGPGILDGAGGSPASPAVVVQTGADNFTLDGVEVKNWTDGVLLEGSHASLKLVNNWLHDNATGFHFDAATALAGVVTIEGNLFKFNTGNGIQNDSAVTVPAIYNAWGNIGGPAAGDGVSANVTATPFTFVEVFTDAAVTAKNVVEGDTFNVQVLANAAGLYAVQYKLTYDPTLLVFQGIANGAFGNCTTNTATAGLITSYCSLLSPAADANGANQVVNTITLKVQPDGSHNGQPSWTTYLDLVHNAGLASAARDGIKAWVDNAGFGAPSSAALDITDDHDGTITIAGLSQYTGYIDLQGRTNDSGALLSAYDQALVAGSTLKATATSASSGAYTTAYVTGQQLVIANTYYFQIDRALYLPTTIKNPAATSWADFKLLDTRPLKTLGSVVLLGGDATNDDLIDVNDAGCIGGAYGSTPTVCGTGGSSDVNGDGKVDILDLTLMGGNYSKAQSPWTE